MKKLFISCPMKGRTDEAIKESMERMHKIAELVFGEPLEPIDTFLEGADYKDNPLKCLGESLKMMQDADYFIGVTDPYHWRGCDMECRAFERYKDGRNCMIAVDGRVLMPDAYEVLDREYEIPTCVR